MMKAKLSWFFRKKRILLPIAVCALLATAGSYSFGAAHPHLQLAKHVDLERMYGGWYIIATMPNRFEKGLVAPYDVYSKRADGDIKEEFYLQKGGFGEPRKKYTVHDWVRPGTNNAHWRLQIFWPINLPFLVMYVDPDYQYVLYGEEGRDLGWIYARNPSIPDAQYKALLKRFAAQGYDTSKFLKFVQKPEDIGKPGYWSDGIAK